jgi:general secretion pathway protein L
MARGAGGLMEQNNALSGLLVELPAHADQPIHWWRVEDGAVIGAGCDMDLAANGAAPGEGGARIVALVPLNDAPMYTLPRPDLPVKQGEALAARQLAARSILPSVHAAAQLFDTPSDGTAMQGAMVDPARLAHGISLLKAHGLEPDYAIPAAVLARHIWWANDNAAVQVEVMGETQWASATAVHPAHLTQLLMPDVEPIEGGQDAVADALIAAFANPAPNFLTGAFAAHSDRRAIKGGQWRTLMMMLLGALLLTLAIGLGSWWRFAAAADAADARALAAMSKAIGAQNDLASGESALDARLAREGRGAAVMSAPLSALYQAMQSAPQVNLRQLRYTPDGTMLATMAAPTSDAANAILLRLQQDGYKVTATARTDDTGAQVVDVTIRGY